MSKLNIDKDSVKNVMGVLSVVATGVIAVINALSDRKHAQEFEDMKKAISDLQNNQ